MKRYFQLSDVVEIRCKGCQSNDINFTIEECEQCGDTIASRCNDCKMEYSYHKFLEGDFKE